MDLLAVLDEDGRLLRINQSACDVLGYTPEELQGPAVRRAGASAGPATRRHARPLPARGDALVREMDMRWLRKDGGIVHLSLSLRWLPLQRRVYASARDISASHAIQAELQKSRNALSALIETMGDAFSRCRATGAFTYVNRKTMALIGRQQHTLLGRVLWEAVPELLGTESLARVPAGDGKRPQQSAFELPRSTGTWHEIRVYPYEDGLSVFFHDVTERLHGADGRYGKASSACATSSP